MNSIKGKSIWGVILICALFVVSGCTDDDDPTPVPNKQAKSAMQAMLDSLIVAGGVPGAAMGIRFQDGEKWIAVSGKANLETNAEVLTSTPFKVGSVSKTYTATVVLDLVKDGLVELDNPISMYLPDTIAAYLPTSEVDSVITVRRALNHTTGIENYVHLPAFQALYGADWTRTWEPIELIAFTVDTLLFDPGTQWSYSNTNYIYLGLMAEHLTGQTLEELIQSVILDPLDLDNTWFPNTDADLPANMSEGYYDLNGNGTIEADETITDASPSAAWAAGAIVANVSDLLNWLDVLDDGSLLTPALQAERETTIDFEIVGEAYGYGLGIARQAEVAWGHQGGIEGFNAIINRHDAGYDFVVLVNANSPVTNHNYADVIYLAAVERLIGGPAKKKMAKQMDVSIDGSDYARGVSVFTR